MFQLNSPVITPNSVFTTKKKKNEKNIGNSDAKAKTIKKSSPVKPNKTHWAIKYINKIQIFKKINCVLLNRYINSDKKIKYSTPRKIKKGFRDINIDYFFYFITKSSKLKT